MRMNIVDAVVASGFMVLGLVSGRNAVAADESASTVYVWRYKPRVIGTDSADKSTDDDSGEWTEGQPMPSDDGDGTTSTMGD